MGANLSRLDALTQLYGLVVRAQARLAATGTPLPLPGAVAEFFEIITQELCLQEHAEERWRRLVESMAPSCLRHSSALTAPAQLLKGAIRLVGGECEEIAIRIPPDVATSFDNLVSGTTVTGRGRWP